MKDLSNKHILHRQKDGLNFLQFRRLLEYPDIAHCFTLKPLDFMSSHEESADLAQKELARVLDIDPARFCKPRQTHTDNIRIVHEEDCGILPPSLQDVDGLITDQKGLALLLTFADCTPLLFYDPVKNVIADIHSGWKGTVQRIGFKAVRKMVQTFDCSPADILCCIGPHIRKCCFEVDADVRDLFMEEFRDMPDLDENITWDPQRKKYFIDTLRINRNLLLSAGLKEENIIDSGICTVCHSDVCHSYRADRAASGRSASVILMK